MNKEPNWFDYGNGLIDLNTVTHVRVVAPEMGVDLRLQPHRLIAVAGSLHTILCHGEAQEVTEMYHRVKAAILKGANGDES